MDTLTELCTRCDSKAGALTITEADIRSAIAITVREPANPEVSNVFCRFIQRPSHHLKADGCDVIMDAGAIPVIFDQLRRWPAHADVVRRAGIALSNLTIEGSAAVKSAMRSVPAYEALLRAARASGLDVHNGRQYAAEVLVTLDKL